MIAFLISLGLSLVISFLLTYAIRRPLYDVLLEVCGTGKRATFWQVFTNTLLYMAPLLAVTLFVGVGSSSDRVLDVDYLRQTIGSIIGGLLITLLVAGWQIKSLIPTSPLYDPRKRITDENYGVSNIDSSRERHNEDIRT